MTKRDSSDVLQYTFDGEHSETVLRHYLLWRKAQGRRVCCDAPGCVFEKEPLVWNGKDLSLILDHKDGVGTDNRPESLHLLCPNCDAQLETRGGRNIGRVEKAEGGFAVIDRTTGVRSYVLPVEVGSYRSSGQDVVIERRPFPDGEEPKTST